MVNNLTESCNIAKWIFPNLVKSFRIIVKLIFLESFWISFWISPKLSKSIWILLDLSESLWIIPNFSESVEHFVCSCLCLELNKEWKMKLGVSYLRSHQSHVYLKNNAKYLHLLLKYLAETNSIILFVFQKPTKH